MNGLFRDFRYAMRQLGKTPGITAAALLMLALGIGVNTAIFGLFYQVLVRTLPVRSPHDLVLLKVTSKFETGHLDMWDGDPETYFAYPAYEALREGNRSLEGLSAATITPATLVSANTTDKSLLQWVSGNYFDLLGIRPTLGRLLVADDDREHAGRHVAVMSENYWRSHFGSDPSVLNQQLEINGSPFTIVGIVRHSGLTDSAPVAVFLPISVMLTRAQEAPEDPLHRTLNIIGRLAPGVSRMQAEVQLNTVWWNWRRDILRTRRENIADESGWLQTHLSLVDAARGIPLLQHTFGEPLATLEFLALLILVIAGANLASLLLAKAISRTREFAVQAALGGSGARILRQVALEGVLLGLIGSGLGVFLGSVTLKLLISLIPGTKNLQYAITAQFGWSSTIFISAGVGVAASLVFSLVPAIFTSRQNLLAALHPQAEAAPKRASTLKALFVSGEIALTLVSLSAAAVFGWGLYQLKNTNLGYDSSQRILTFRVNASLLGKSDAQVKNEYAEITQAIRQQPGVHSVAYAAEGLLDDGEMGSDVTVADYSLKGKEESPPDQNWVTPNFFATLRIPLIAGRFFTDQDTQASSRVAIVDEAFVNRYFARNIEKAIISQFGFGRGNSVKLNYRIVGIVPTIRATSLNGPPGVPFIYLPYDQTYQASDADPRQHPASFYVNTAGDTSALAPVLKNLIHGIDRNLPIIGLQTMQGRLNDVMFEMRMSSVLSIAMGGLAVVLAAIGLYGLLAFVVACRTQEIGIRMALGANRQQIASLIARRLLQIVSAGMFAGALFGWVTTHVLASRNADLAHTPLWLFGATLLLLLIALLAAAALPARRAAKVDPMVALRYE